MAFDWGSGFSGIQSSLSLATQTWIRSLPADYVSKGWREGINLIWGEFANPECLMSLRGRMAEDLGLAEEFCNSAVPLFGDVECTKLV